MNLPIRSCLVASCLVPGLLAMAATASSAAQPVPGPVQARVVKVHDGDSFSVEAQVWPGTVVSVSIRVRGIDAPELRAKCPLERLLARQARDVLAGRISKGNISLSNIGGDKYYGRVLADVTLDDGSNLAQVLLGSQHVRPYAGKKRKGWCAALHQSGRTGK